MRHPAIANSRIIFYDKKIVGFFYLDHKTKKRIVCELKVFDFIASVVQHIPDKNFKMVRYYGLYSRKGTRKVGKICLQSSLKQNILFSEAEREVFRCPHCLEKMVFVAYFKEPPDSLREMVKDGRFF